MSSEGRERGRQTILSFLGYADVVLSGLGLGLHLIWDEMRHASLIIFELCELPQRHHRDC